METNKEIVQKVNEAFSNNDTEAFLSYCAEDAKWLMIGSPVLDGKEAIRNFMKPMSSVNAPEINSEKIIADGDMVAATGTMKMKKNNGDDYHGGYCDIYRFENGKIKEMNTYVVELKNG